MGCMENCLGYYIKNHVVSTKYPTEIPENRLKIIDKILKSAYIDDISIHIFRDKYFYYFFECMNLDERNAFFKNYPGLGYPTSNTELLTKCKKLSVLEFDIFFNHISDECILQISKDIREFLCFMV